MSDEPSVLEVLQRRTLLLDGGTGSALIEAGLSPGEPSELWNVTHPYRVEQIYRSFFEAGSDVVHTNTFGANRIRLKASGLEDRHEELNREAVKIARSARPPGRFVSGDIGPTGARLPPWGRASVEDLRDAFVEQARVLADEGVDLFSVETISDLREALNAVRSIRTVSDLPIIASVTFHKDPNGFRTAASNSPRQVVQTLESAGASIIGTNCNLDGSEMLGLARELVKWANQPVAVQPQAGEPQARNDQFVYDLTPEQFVESVSDLLHVGVRVVGGCCGVEARHIGAVKEKLIPEAAS